MRNICAILFTSILVIVLLWFSNGCKNDATTPRPHGAEWQVFNTANSPLRSNTIYCITVAENGTVWLGTEKGAYAYRNGSWEVVVDSLTYTMYINGGSVTSARVNAIAEGNRCVWFGLYGGGIRVLNPFSEGLVWQTYRKPTIPWDFINQIAAARNKEADVWVATNFGVGHYVPGPKNPDYGDWYKLIVPPLQNIFVRSVAVDPVSWQVYFGTDSGAATYSEITGWEYITIPKDFGGDYSMNAIGIDTGAIWMGHGQFLTRYGRDYHHRVYHYTTQNTNGGLPFATINAIATNYFSSRWFGTDIGLACLTDTTWSMYTHENSPLPANKVLSLAFDINRGNLWIGTNNGAAVYKKGGVKQ